MVSANARSGAYASNRGTLQMHRRGKNGRLQAFGAHPLRYQVPHCDERPAVLRATVQQQITLGSRVLVSGTPEQVSELITEGAPVNYLDVMKRTPLHWASERYGPTLRFA